MFGTATTLRISMVKFFNDQVLLTPSFGSAAVLACGCCGGGCSCGKVGCSCFYGSDK